MKKLTNNQIFDIRAKRVALIENELNVCKGVSEDFDVYMVRNKYYQFLEGVSVGSGIPMSDLEDMLDKSMLGSHDTKHLLQHNDLKDLYNMVVDHRKYAVREDGTK